MNYKRTLPALALLFVVLVVFTGWANYHIHAESAAYLTSDTAKLKPVKAGLLLGTIRTVRSGTPNPFFFNRIKAAAMLYHSGKVKVIIVSGDNSKQSYNEPEDMKQELIKLGVPESAIYMDYAGFRTLDSVVRCRDIFGQQQYVIISQRFHNQRAVFLARQKGIDAYGFNADDVTAMQGIKTNLREYLACDKAMLDLLINRQPRFYGNKVTIN